MSSLFSIIILTIVGVILYQILEKNYPVTDLAIRTNKPEEIEIPESHKIEVEEPKEKQDENTVHLV